MNKVVLIIGFGSIGKKHAKILSKLVGKKNIYVLSNQTNLPYKSISSPEAINTLNPDYVVVASDTTKHFDQVRLLDEKLTNKMILVEKPLFDKYRNFTPLNNEFFVGYNLRFNPLLKKLKQNMKSEEILAISSTCHSYLPKWRKEQDYRNSSSAHQSRGGGVLLDLSHEIDLLHFLLEDKIDHSWSFNKQISSLEIDTDDYLLAFGTSNKTICKVETSYFSFHEKRILEVKTKNYSYELDFINSSLVVSSEENQETFQESILMDDTYSRQHEQILSGNRINVCSYKEGLQVLAFIDQVRKSNGR